MKSSLCSLVVAISFVVSVGAATDEAVVAGFHETAVRFVGEGGAVTEQQRVIGGGGNIYKTGTGRWNLPVSAIDQSADIEIGVKEGDLSLSKDDSSVTMGTRPDAVLTKAALWLDATKNTVASGTDADRVTIWRDAREASAAGTQYGYAKAETRDGCPLSGKDPQLVTLDGRRALYFGGLGSGQYMNLCDASGADRDIRMIHHTFVVQTYVSTWGNFLGNYILSRDFAMHPDGTAIYTDGANVNYAAYSGRTFADGELVDGFATAPKKGCWLWETTLVDPLAHVEALFTISANTTWGTKGFDAGRQGGDYVSEVILFTNRLSEVERLQVEAYLMDRWNLRTTPSVSVKLAAGARLVADCADTEPAAPLKLSGEGALALENAVHVTLDPAEEHAFTGDVRLRNSSLDTRGAHEFAFALAAGETINAVLTDQGYFYTNRTSGASGTFVKDGNGPLKVRAISAGVDRVEVNGGTLVLSSADAGETLLPGSTVAVEIPNGDFESVAVTGSTDDHIEPIGVGETKHGWTGAAARLSPNRKVGIYSGVAVGWWGKYYLGESPAGRQALVMQQGGGAYTHVTIPQDGDYDFGCYVSSKAGDLHNARVDVMIGKTWETAEKVAALYCEMRAFQRRTIRLHGLKAGDFVFGLRLSENDVNFTEIATVDGLTLTLVSAIGKKAAYRIPNGDFESVLPSYPKGSGNTTMPYYMTFWDVAAAAQMSATMDHSIQDTKGQSAKNGWMNEQLSAPADLATHLLCDGWTLSKTKYTDTAVEQPIEFTSSTTPLCHPWDTGIFNGSRYLNSRGASTYDAAGEGGGVNLTFASDGGLATTVFAPPAGRYRLRCRAAKWVLSWNCNYWTGQTPKLRAKVIVASSGAEGVETDLGLVQPASHQMKDYVWGVPFVVGEGQQVTLKLYNEEANGMAVTDDYVLDAAPQEIVVNGGFETSEGWVGADRWSNGSVANYGSGRYEGNYHAYIQRTGSIYQPITLAAGEYRLVYHTRGRYAEPPTSWDGKYHPEFADQILQAELVGTDHTKVLSSVTTYTTNYVRHACTFMIRQEEAGEYKLTFRGMSELDRACFLDGVLIEPVERLSRETPSVASKPEVVVAAGAKLQLEYPGQVVFEKLKLGGTSVHGVINAQTHPEWITGTGSVYVERKGLVLVVE